MVSSGVADQERERRQGRQIEMLQISLGREGEELDAERKGKSHDRETVSHAAFSADVRSNDGVRNCRERLSRARSLFWFWGGRSRVQPPTSDPSTLITFSTRLDTKVDERFLQITISV